MNRLCALTIDGLLFTFRLFDALVRMTHYYPLRFGMTAATEPSGVIKSALHPRETDGHSVRATLEPKIRSTCERTARRLLTSRNDMRASPLFHRNISRWLTLD
jgi:hypothetical protein